MKKDLRFSEKEEDRCKEVEEEEEDGSLDRLLLIQSDFSSLVHQVTTLSLPPCDLFVSRENDFEKQGLHLALCILQSR